MNNADIALFKCLCLDLNMPFRASVPDLPAIGTLRDELLVLVEDDFRNQDAYASWDSRFRKMFAPSYTAEDIILPVVFRDVYQVLSFLLKIPTPLTDELKDKYISGFEANEKDTKAWKVDRTCDYSRLARYIVRRTCSRLDLSAASVAGNCRHGPGAVFDGELGSDKDHFVNPPLDIQLEYGPEVFFANASFYAEYEFSGARPYGENRHVVARLALVPKTFKSVRGVFVSPKEAMFCQLGQSEVLLRYLRGTWVNNCYSHDSQAPSQELAWSGSGTKETATLDLSDASDRIPLALIAYLFSRSDYVRLARTRPSYAIMPDNTRHKLAMYAPMGDGLTFPVLTLVCSVLVMTALLQQDGYVAARPPSMDVLTRYSRKFRVFGDDIIVPARYYQNTVKCLELHNLKVNVRKSFANGYFRESCGCDAYCGVDVTPLKMRVTLAPQEDVFRLIAFHNLIKVRHGTRLTRTVQYVRTYIESEYKSVGYTSYPKGVPGCLWVSRTEIFDPEIPVLYKGHPRLPMDRYVPLSYPCLDLFEKKKIPVRWNPDLMVWEQRVITPAKEQSLPDGCPWWGLNAYLLAPPSSLPREGKRLGSRETLRAYNRFARAHGMRVIPEVRGRVAHGWVELT